MLLMFIKREKRTIKQVCNTSFWLSKMASQLNRPFFYSFPAVSWEGIKVTRCQTLKIINGSLLSCYRLRRVSYLNECGNFFIYTHIQAVFCWNKGKIFLKSLLPYLLVYFAWHGGLHIQVKELIITLWHHRRGCPHLSNLELHLWK